MCALARHLTPPCSLSNAVAGSPLLRDSVLHITVCFNVREKCRDQIFLMGSKQCYMTDSEPQSLLVTFRFYNSMLTVKAPIARGSKTTPKQPQNIVEFPPVLTVDTVFFCL